MKKTLKLIVLSLASILMVACDEFNKKPAETPQEPASSEVVQESSQEESASQSQESTQNQTSDESSQNESSQEETPSQDEKTEDSVTFNFYVSGEDEALGEFFLNDAEGLTIYEAMEKLDGLDFTFDEDEQVIGEILGVKNDYVEWKTWTYLYNGQFAEVGPKTQTLEKGDVIDWYYGTTDQLPVNIIPAE